MPKNDLVGFGTHTFPPQTPCSPTNTPFKLSQARLRVIPSGAPVRKPRKVSRQLEPAVWALYGARKQALGQKNELWLILFQEHSYIYTGAYFQVRPKECTKAHSFFISLFYKGHIHDAKTA